MVRGGKFTITATFKESTILPIGSQFCHIFTCQVIHFRIILSPFTTIHHHFKPYSSMNIPKYPYIVKVVYYHLFPLLLIN